MAQDPAEPLLLTPGPVSTSRSVKSAMMRDRASGGDEFHADLEHARAYMVGLVHGEGAYTAVPLPGSATYANEGVIAGSATTACSNISAVGGLNAAVRITAYGVPRCAAISISRSP